MLVNLSWYIGCFFWNVSKIYIGNEVCKLKMYRKTVKQIFTMCTYMKKRKSILISTTMKTLYSSINLTFTLLCTHLLLKKKIIKKTNDSGKVRGATFV